MSHDFVSNNPRLMKEWNWEKNNALGFFPDNLTCGSSKVVWWKCSVCGHEWSTKISHRNNGTTCKMCNSKKLSTAPFEKSLAFLFPDIAEEWDFSKNSVSPSEVYPQSNKMFWWICDKGHGWQDSPSHRTNRKNSCPVCSNRTVLPGFNDLASTHPELMKDWDWEKNEKLGISPYNISYGSNTIVFWKCQFGHSWSSKVYSRTTDKQGCPFCSKELKVSFPEKTIVYYLNTLPTEVVENYKNCSLGKQEIDIYIPSIKLGIEYDGFYWHQSNKNDLTKDNKCLENNITLIRIREPGCPIYDSSAIKINLPNRSISALEDAIRTIFKILQENFEIVSSCDINIDRDSSEILSSVLSRDKINSVAKSNFYNEWNWTKNKGLDPKHIHVNSNKKVWWICDKGHEWNVSPAHRNRGHKCPICAGQTVLPGFNDLFTLFPNIAKEWDSDRNNISANNVSARSNKKYFWICSTCGHRWETSIYVRTSMGCGCPECSKKKISKSASRGVRNLTKDICYDSLKDAALDNNISSSAISNCCRGKTKTAGGYRWEYINNYSTKE